MLSLIKRVLIFSCVFILFGASFWLVDLFTKGKYGLFEKAKLARGIATTRIHGFLSVGFAAWWRSPILFVSYVISPFLFVFIFVLVMIDCFRKAEVFYDDEGKRFVYRGATLTEEDIDKNPRKDDWFSSRLATIFGGGDTGVLYRGGPIPAGWAPEHTLSTKERRKALDLAWRRMELGGNFWYAPPLEADQSVPLSEWEEVKE